MTRHFFDRLRTSCVGLGIFLLLLTLPAVSKAQGMSTPDNAYSYSFTSNDGHPLPLSSYKGKVLLVVNTASLCGFTPQYAGLEKLYETYKGKGLVVLGVPSDNFGSQEPGSDADIKSFTTTKFHISFPLTTKTDVVGTNRHPFYAWADAQNKGELFSKAPHWNFHKYLVSRHGELLNSFGSSTTPDSSAIIEAVEKALNEAP